ncbi:MAG: hypothetical protein PHN57_03550 [Candidatus Omnitrophica bacterium]|nr:hypothetical protein [Candidatus Omnitrophota bacterium]
MSKFLLASGVVTFLCLLYVWQQTEILRLAYVGQKDVSTFQDLLDKNSALRYNLKRNTSLTHLGNKVSETQDFQMPETYCLVKLNSPEENLKTSNFNFTRKENLLARLFSIKRQAEAQTIAPSHR